MKFSLIAFVFLFALSLNAQIPDSLNVDLPWETVYLADCTSTMGEEPSSDDEDIFITLDTDIVHVNASGDCFLRFRTWVILDWDSEIVYNYIQTGKIDLEDPLVCQQDLFIPYDQLPFTLDKNNAALDVIDGHVYSFDYDDLGDVSRVLNVGEESNYDIYLYDHTGFKVCKLNVYITDCEEDLVLDFPETAEINFEGESYIQLTLEMLGINIVNPCGTYSTEMVIWNSSGNFLLSNSVDKIVPVKVNVLFDDGTKYSKIVLVTVTGIKPDPIPMYIEEKSFTAGETVIVDIWSEEILQLSYWQLQLKFVDAKIIGFQAGEIFNEIPHNIFEDDQTLRTLWTQFDQSPIEPLDMVSNATWFSLVIKPEIDGSTLDVLETGLDPWSAIGIQGEDFIFEYEADFVFNVSPRDILNDVDLISNLDFEVFPNPASNTLNISGLPLSDQPTVIELFNTNGALVLQKTYSNHEATVTLDISEMPNGIFTLKAQNGRAISTQKICKI